MKIVQTTKNKEIYVLTFLKEQNKIIFVIST